MEQWLDNPAELRNKRIRKGYTQTEVAIALGLAPTSDACVCDWEAGRVRVPDKHRKKLLELYK